MRALIFPHLDNPLEFSKKFYDPSESDYLESIKTQIECRFCNKKEAEVHERKKILQIYGNSGMRALRTDISVDLHLWLQKALRIGNLLFDCH